MLGTDRLGGMGVPALAAQFGDQFAGGYQKNWFSSIRNAGSNFGSGLDTFVILEERPDIRVMVEATLSHLFSRNIQFEWDSGNLIPLVNSPKNVTYRMDRDECHGIRELLVLLTHLYNDEYGSLIIDEPELNLHPQYQAFFMQEVRKIAGAPEKASRNKIIFLITHSPFIVDLKSADDLQSIISFTSDHAMPTFIDQKSAENGRLSSLIPRLNVHHKQLFFSDNPIFVEGVLDQQLIEAIQEHRGVSITAAGSCIIEAGGCEEVNKYLELCNALKKKAYFFYDLDSLFSGNLRQCIRADGEVSDFLATLGIGNDFGRYCGELDRKLTDAVKLIRSKNPITEQDKGLREYIESLAVDGEIKDKNLARARNAVAMDTARRRNEVSSIIGETNLKDIEGRISRIVDILSAKNVLVLPGGAIEHFLPSYTGNPYKLEDAAKRRAVEAEVTLLSSNSVAEGLALRYGALFINIERLPAKPSVDTDSVLLKYLGDYVHQLQGLVVGNPNWTLEEINVHFTSAGTATLGKLFAIEKFSRGEKTDFAATIRINEPAKRFIRVSHETNAGMRKFDLQSDANHR
jgi:predicted ATPase